MTVIVSAGSTVADPLDAMADAEGVDVLPVSVAVMFSVMLLVSLTDAVLQL